PCRGARGPPRACVVATYVVERLRTGRESPPRACRVDMPLRRGAVRPARAARRAARLAAPRAAAHRRRRHDRAAPRPGSRRPARFRRARGVAGGGGGEEVPIGAAGAVDAPRGGPPPPLLPAPLHIAADGTIAPPPGPGLGVRPDFDALEEWRVR